MMRYRLWPLALLALMHLGALSGVARTRNTPDAEVLEWTVAISGEEDLVREHRVVMAIHTDKGVDEQGKIELLHWQGRVDQVKATTILLDGRRLPLKQSAVFEYDRLSAGVLSIRTTAFAVPSLEPGVEVEYSWRTTRKGRIPDQIRLNFQRNIPVNSVSYDIDLPVDNGDEWRVQALNCQPSVSRSGPGQLTLSMVDVPTSRSEPHSPPSWDRAPVVLLHRVESGQSSGEDFWRARGAAVAKAASGCFKSCKELHALAAGTSAGKGPLGRLKALQDVARRIGNPSAEDSVSHYELLSVLEYWSPKELLATDAKLRQKAFLRGRSGVNLLFGALAADAGHEVRVALVADRTEGAFDPRVARPRALSTLMVAVRVEGKWTVMDPGSAHLPLGALRWENEGQQALLADRKGALFITTPRSEASASTELRTARLSLGARGKLEGTIRVEMSGQSAFRERSWLKEHGAGLRLDQLQDEFEERLGEAEIHGLRVLHVDDPEKKLVYECRVTSQRHATRSGSFLILSPSFFHRFMKTDFTATRRENPIAVDFRWTRVDDVRIELPAGFELTAQAEDVNLKTSLGRFHSNLHSKADSHELSFRRNFVYEADGKQVLPASSHSSLSKLFGVARKSDLQVVTLRSSDSTTRAEE